MAMPSAAEAGSQIALQQSRGSFRSVSKVMFETATRFGRRDSATIPLESFDDIVNGDFDSVLSKLRDNIIGRDQILEGPFGPRLKLYMDYTASGQGLHFINRSMTLIRESFANTHTEDSATGRFMTSTLHTALRSIEACVNASDEFVAIAAGTGCTGALLRLQQILGIYIPPAAWATLALLAGGPAPASLVGWPQEPLEMAVLPHDGVGPPGSQSPEWLRSREAVKSSLRARGALPLVLVGGYEHHSNELSWRAGLCDVVRVPLTGDFRLDLPAMERVLERARAAQPGRAIVGSISACSNVTGMNTDLEAVSAILRRHGARFFVDFAASGPYTEIDCLPEGRRDFFDGFVLSPHKFLGGDGSCGLLVLRKSVYDLGLPPTFAGGGTVLAVGKQSLSFTSDIVERESAGTPGALQIFQCALAFELKRALGPDRIERREQELLRDFFAWASQEHSGSIHILGNQDPCLRHPIISFNVTGPTPLHPRFVTVLLSDLFGVQTRAGCSCAGPHAVDLLGMSEKMERGTIDLLVGSSGDAEPARQDRRQVEDLGVHAVKPGWCRLNLHYTLDEDEFWFLKEVLSFVVQHGAAFLSVYCFDALSGAWEFSPPEELARRLEEADASTGAFSLDSALRGGEERSLCDSQRRRAVFEASLRTARRLASALPADPALAPPPAPFPSMVFDTHGPQPFFLVAEGQVRNLEEMAARIEKAAARSAARTASGAAGAPGAMAAAHVGGAGRKAAKAWALKAVPHMFRRRPRAAVE